MGRRSFLASLLLVFISPWLSLRKKRRLTATWCYEVAEDIRLSRNPEAEEELTRVLAQEINAEIDREALRAIRIAA